MIRVRSRADPVFLLTTLLLVVIGIFVFSSASLGLLTRSGATFKSVALSQFVFGVGGGLVLLIVASRVPYRFYRRIAPYFYLVALAVTALVFVPGIGLELKGARRWLEIFGFSFQPAELLKVAFIFCTAWYYSMVAQHMDSFRASLGGIAVIMLLAGIVLLPQPDTGTFTILALTGGAMCFAAGMKFRHVAVLGGILAIGLCILAFARPYLLERVLTFMHPVTDPQGAGYQIKQSLIAVGSGGWVGRGFGQSIQKFQYLPEANSDSIFSVAAEEFGFLGSTTLILLFLLFTIRGLTLASRAPDRFGGLVIVGLVILIVTQSFINIASMLGLMPLTGEPLVFISHGGTALMVALGSVGVVLNISTFSRKST